MTAAARDRGRFGWSLAAVFALGAAVRGWLLARPLAALDGRALPDDAYLAFEIAKAIGTGHGPRFGDYLTNGFQPLFVWLVALPWGLVDPARLGDPAVLDGMAKLALGLGCGFDLGSLLLLAAIVRRGTGSRSAGLLAALLWAVQPAVLRCAVNGLETSTAIFFLLAAWCLSLRHPFATASLRSLFALGALVGVGAMARVDLLLLGIFFAWESLTALRARAPGWWARNAALGAGTLVGYAPWMVYSAVYTGSILPGSGRAVRWISLTDADHALDAGFYVSMLADGVRAIDANLPFLAKLALALVVLAASSRLRTGWRRLDPPVPNAVPPLDWLRLPLVFGLTVFLAYTTYVFAPWFFPRYLAPLNVAVIAVVAAGAAALALRAGPRERSAWLAFGIAGLAACTLQPRFRELTLEPPDPWAGYRNLGLWARRAFEPGTVVGATQSGALAYYADGVRVVNLDGVVNDRAYEQVVSGRALDYIREEGIDYVVAWHLNFEYLRKNSSGFRPRDLRMSAYLDGFRSWGIQWQVYRVGYPPGRATPALRPVR